MGPRLPAYRGLPRAGRSRDAGTRDSVTRDRERLDRAISRAVRPVPGPDESPMTRSVRASRTPDQCANGRGPG